MQSSQVDLLEKSEVVNAQSHSDAMGNTVERGGGEVGRWRMGVCSSEKL